MNDRYAVLHQYLLPKKALTALAGRLAHWQGGRWTSLMVRNFVRRYGVDMSEALDPDIKSYPSFNAFFTRGLRPGARPVAPAEIVSPVDGAVSQLGRIDKDQIFQAKGRSYSATALLGGDPELAAHFQDGLFATLYLSPRDYHRVHMPCDGRLRRMIHVPGELFSVNPVTARGVDRLFARNERVVCVFDSEQGVFAMVLVGATIVGSIATAWHGIVNTARTGQLKEWTYHEQDVVLAKGEEMGRFLLGSTVVLLFPKNRCHLNPDWAPERVIRQGEAMASRYDALMR
ncbi:archaetidylserine decarboxylase [Orrella sp. JC864]|uniref:archaetidylserine decarboxylase n=1 Tax=Orrella sp. JC864 TaxID=3120298 RepID=UPI00300931B5